MKNHILSLVKYNGFIKWLTGAAIVVAASLPGIMYAQTVQLDNPLCNNNAGGKCIGTLPEFIKELIGIALIIGIPVVVLGIIYSGFLFIQAQGKPDKLTAAKNALLWSAIGGGILLGAWTIALVIGRTVEQF